jgi:Protein of unknown function (DUF2848)
VSHQLTLTLHDGPNARPATIAVADTVIAGWTGRDAAAVEKHIKELEELGVKRPASTPIFYRVSAARLTCASEIEAVGEASGGEAEFVLLQHGGRLWVGTGSDHTDREAEKYGVTVSKQMCDKPIASQFWAYDEVIPHWDRLVLRSHVVEGGERKLYQEGAVSAMLHPRDLLERHSASQDARERADAASQDARERADAASQDARERADAASQDARERADGKGGKLAEGTMMFGGTLAARGGVRATQEFAFELEDPVLGRRIAHAYRVRTLPILG